MNSFMQTVGSHNNEAKMNRSYQRGFSQETGGFQLPSINPNNNSYLGNMSQSYLDENNRCHQNNGNILDQVYALQNDRIGNANSNFNSLKTRVLNQSQASNLSQSV